MAWRSGVAAATTSRANPASNPFPYICLPCLDDGPVMWSLMAFAQFLATVLIVWAALDFYRTVLGV